MLSPCTLLQAAAFDSVSGNGRGARPGGRPALAARVGAEGGQAAYMFVAPLQELSMDDACGPEVGPGLPWRGSWSAIRLGRFWDTPEARADAVWWT